MGNDAKFHYAIPDYVAGLSRSANVALAGASLASRLVQESRWIGTRHPDGRAENVAEHSLMCAKVAYALAREMYSQLDAGKVVTYAIMHDDVEAYVGDTPTQNMSRSELAKKKTRESVGLARLVEEFSDMMPEYTVLSSLYEAQSDDEARFVRVVDKLMTVLIHLPDEGAALREHWTFESWAWWSIQIANELLDEYPEYEALINVRTELAMYIARKYLK